MQHRVLDFEIAVDLRPAIPYLLMALDSQRANRILNMGFNEQHPTPLSLIRAGAIRKRARAIQQRYGAAKADQAE